MNAQVSYHYNQAKAFNEYIEEGSWSFRAQDRWNVQNVDLKKVSLNKKDIMGNDLYRYDFTLKDGEECSLVPDNYFYPMAYIFVTKRDKRYSMSIHNYTYYYLAMGSGLIVSVKPSIGVSLDDDNKYSRIMFQENNYNYLDRRPKNFISTGSFVKGNGKGSPYSNWGEFIDAEGYKFKYNPSGTGSYGYQYKGLDTFYVKMKEYIANILKESKEKGYDKMMSEFEDGEYFFYGSGKFGANKDGETMSEGNVKLIFNKENGICKTIKAQKSFDDGKYYDKEKFFFELKCGLNTSSNSICFVPFDGKIIVVSIYNKTISSIYGVFSKNPFDASAIHMTSGNDKKLWLFNEMSEKYFCQNELESKYDKEKDPLYFWTIMHDLFSALYSK